MDVHTPKQRSFNMSKIRHKDTKPELLVRRWLWHRGHRYRLHCNHVPGKPDIVFLGLKKVIFIHGCFWHKHECKYFKWPETNAEFWKRKIEGNVKRDQESYRALISADWDYLILWECAIRHFKQHDQQEELENVGHYIETFLADDNHQCMQIDRTGLQIHLEFS